MAHIAGYLHAAAAAEHGAPAPPAPLFLCEGRATSALEASSRVAALASGLCQLLGMQPGDRVCVAALATDRCFEALLAVTAGGGVAAPLNWRWAPGEGAAAAAHVGARLLVSDAACLPWALGVAAALPAGTLDGLVLLGPPAGFCQRQLDAAPRGLALSFAEALVAGCPDTSLALRYAPGDAALIVFTSGTTGAPKGVTLSHAALHAQSMAKLLACGYCPADVYLHAAPLFHIGGLSSALATLAARGRHVFLPRFDGAALLAAVEAHGVTCFIAVPAMAADLLAAAAEARVAALPSVARVLVGGGGLSPNLLAGLASLCPAAVVHAAYGMTEGASSLTFATLRRPGDGLAAGDADAGDGPGGGVYVGRPPPGIELAVYRPPGGPSPAAASAAGGGVALQGEGEVVTRGPHVMLGYWDDEEATAAASLPGGWLRTGDLGCLRQGRLWLLGRAKDMIKSGGENVHAWEVERSLASHPGVAAAAVVGVAHWRLGEAVAAAVVLRPGWRWRGEPCQALLPSAASGSAARRKAGQEALAAAAAAVAPAVRSGSLGDEESGEEAAAGGGGGIGGAVCEEDLSGLLLRRSPSRPASAQAAVGGLLAAAPLPDSPPARSRRSEALQLLAGIAAGLERAAAAADRDSGAGGAASDADCWLDGAALQQHCRAAGLAGFKLPRVFLLRDVAGKPGAARAAGGTTAAAVLPLNSAGKVVKHLLRQQVQQAMQQAAAAAGSAPATAGKPRSRL